MVLQVFSRPMPSVVGGNHSRRLEAERPGSVLVVPGDRGKTKEFSSDRYLGLCRTGSDHLDVYPGPGYRRSATTVDSSRRVDSLRVFNFVRVTFPPRGGLCGRWAPSSPGSTGPKGYHDIECVGDPTNCRSIWGILSGGLVSPGAKKCLIS